jgi:hypothetical protein
MKRRRRRSLVDTLLANLQGTPGPAVRIPRENTPRAIPERTGRLRPVRQSSN